MTNLDIPQLVPGALTVAVTSGKGGVGKTTTVVALAANLTAAGYNVIVVDADLAGPNVHLIAELGDVTLTAVAEPLSLNLPVSPHGFRVSTPVSITHATGVGTHVSVNDLGAMAQYAQACDIVIVDLPPGWTNEHDAVARMLPDVIVAVVAPTAAAISDHDRHQTAWSDAWTTATDKVRSRDKRRKWNELPAAPTVVTVETMARFTGIADTGGAPITIRRSDAVTADEMCEAVNPVTSVTSAATMSELAATAEVGVLVAAVLAARRT